MAGASKGRTNDILLSALFAAIQGKGWAFLKDKLKEPTGEVKRVTVDLPVKLHQKLKIKCVLERVRIADMVRSWIEEKCGG